MVSSLALSLQSTINKGVGWHQFWGSDPHWGSLVCMWNEGGIRCPRWTTWSQGGSHRYILSIDLNPLSTFGSRWLLCLDGQDQGCASRGGSVPGWWCYLARWSGLHPSHQKCPSCLFGICREDSPWRPGSKVQWHLANRAGICWKIYIHIFTSIWKGQQNLLLLLCVIESSLINQCFLVDLGNPQAQG